MDKVVLCTGANRGLCYSILQVAGLPDPFTMFILSCRNKERGHAAAESPVKVGVKAAIEVLQLDVSNDVQRLSIC